MSRGLGAFLAFVGIVAVLLGLVAVNLGGNVLRFVFHDDRSSAPFVMVNLMDFADADAQAAYVGGYGRETLEMVEALGGRNLWNGRTDQLIVGNADDEWQVLALVEYPSRAKFIDMVTSGEYRSRLDAREQALQRTAVFAGTPRFDFEPDTQVTYVIRLTLLGEDADYAVFEDRWGEQEQELLERHGGRLAWSADLNPLVAEETEQFDRITFIGFDSPAAASAWALDPERETLVSLEQRLLARDVTLQARASEVFARGANR